MSANKDKKNERADEGISEMLKLVLDEYRKSVFTSIPAIVESYDPVTKRADLQPTPLTAFIDGTLGAMPILPNVPVLLPSGGGYCISLPIKRGDTVLVVFCQRGIKNFKKTYGLEEPSGGVLDVNSPVAIPCFGALSISPSAGISLQKEDGSVKVEVLDGSVKMTTTGGSMELSSSGDVECSGIVKAADFETTDGYTLKGHKHTGASSGSPTSDATGQPPS